MFLDFRIISTWYVDILKVTICVITHLMTSLLLVYDQTEMIDPNAQFLVGFDWGDVISLFCGDKPVLQAGKLPCSKS